jgi:hypothetical protein
MGGVAGIFARSHLPMASMRSEDASANNFPTTTPGHPPAQPSGSTQLTGQGSDIP